MRNKIARWTARLCTRLTAGLAAALIAGAALAGPAFAPAIFHTDKGDLRCSLTEGQAACLGVPYAAPPVGERRFRPPAPAASWPGRREATRFGDPCLQSANAYVARQQGSEDCLYLNIYVPPAAQTGGALPVMVWLHGGGFISGSGNAFNGAYLAKTAHAIVVTVNYRLGPFGWLALASLTAENRAGVAGNYGLLDSLAALQWVQRNAANFGGDPHRVTLFGQSAGGEQTLALVASPYAAGLFQRAISMSAPASLSLPTLSKVEPKRAAFLKAVGCIDPARQPACLRHVDAQKLLDAAHESWNLIADGGLAWTPTVDGAVLPDQWLKLFQSGRFNHVPLMLGHTRDEGRLFVAIFDNAQNRPMTETEVRDIAQANFHAASYFILQQYPPQAFKTPGEQMAAILVDAQFVAGQTDDRQALARFTPVYAYESCDPAAAESHVHARFNQIGCGHDSDLGSLFQWDDFGGRRPNFSPQQQALAETMGRYWGAFAATGDPNTAGLPHWPRQLSGEAPVMVLGSAASGGVHAISGQTYETEHKTAFWRLIRWFAHLTGR